ncbi:MAG: radical SAM family heme chaperone HemW [Dongiaceae bacterium]
MPALALYIHWPYCLKRCPYCDYNAHVRENFSENKWLENIKADFLHYRALSGARELTSIFFGGGTPSLASGKMIGEALKAANDCWPIANNCEITLEANPTSIENQKLRDFKAAGINRLSLGIQALNDPDLKFLGRNHSATEAKEAVHLAGKIFERYSIDLIYARPGQQAAAWRQELTAALALINGHISVYQLSVEPQTAFAATYARGDFALPNEELATSLYEISAEILEKNNLPAYEISNHAAKGQECRHNLAYWRYQDYIGAGPGAHGRLTIGGVKHASENPKLPEAWFENRNLPLRALTPEERGEEMLLMGLRLQEGVPSFDFKKETGKELVEFLPPQKLNDLIAHELLIYENGVLRASAQGRRTLNSVLNYLLN